MKKIIFGCVLSFVSLALAADPCFENDVQPGSKCDGGSVFAGTYNGQNYMTTPSDGLITAWGAFDTHTGVIDPDSGLENTKKLASLSPPANYCYNLQFGGYSDWFLPSENELLMILDNAQAIGAFGSDWYWSSTESAPHPNMYPVTVRGSRASLGRPTNLLKEWECVTRCVRLASLPD